MQQQTNLLPLLLVIVLAVLLLRQPSPEPEPDPEPDPEPNRPVVSLVQRIARRLVPAGTARATDARQIAGIYRSLAAEIATLRDPLSTSKLKRPSDPLQEADRQIRAALGSRYATWQPVFDQLASALAVLDEQGDIGRTIYAVGEVFTALAVGLETL